MISNTVLYTLKCAEGADLMLSALTTKRGKKQSWWRKTFRGDGYVYDTDGGMVMVSCILISKHTNLCTLSTAFAISSTPQ